MEAVRLYLPYFFLKLVNWWIINTSKEVVNESYTWNFKKKKKKEKKRKIKIVIKQGTTYTCYLTRSTWELGSNSFLGWFHSTIVAWSYLHSELERDPHNKLLNGLHSSSCSINIRSTIEEDGNKNPWKNVDESNV